MKKNRNQPNRTASAQKREKSCGAIVYRRESGNVLYLIIQQKSRHWSFPKGHVERGESEKETALREIREETGLCVPSAAISARSTAFQRVSATSRTSCIFLPKRIVPRCAYSRRKSFRAAGAIFAKRSGSLRFLPIVKSCRKHTPP